MIVDRILLCAVKNLSILVFCTVRKSRIVDPVLAALMQCKTHDFVVQSKLCKIALEFFRRTRLTGDERIVVVCIVLSNYVL